MIVTVCICTYRRQELLDALLASIEAMEDPGGDVHVVVVDNDVNGSAAPILERHSGLDLSYDIEPLRSISAVRNRSVRIALGIGPDLIAFLDDDQTVDSRWLPNLLRAFEEFDAGAVAGAVIPVLEQAPAWVHRGRFFVRARHRSGSRVIPSGLANLIVSASALAATPDPFGTHFGRPGGEDSYFLARFSSQYGEPYWCDDAVVYEHVPAERATARWLLARALYFGQAYSEALRLRDPSRGRIVIRAAKCCVRVMQGIVLLPAALVAGRAAMVRAAGYTCSGIGGLLGLSTAIE